MISTNKIPPAAGTVIIDNQGRVLLVQEKWEKVRGLWNLPAGIQDKGEKLQETAAREAEEEVGFKVKIINPEPLCIKESDSSGRDLYSFEAEIIGGRLSPQLEEILDAKWLNLDEIADLNREGKIRDPWVIESIHRAEERKETERTNV
jgi:8-oxo-dGTP pyrophosphatase MutT (NUDIX family)